MPTAHYRRLRAAYVLRPLKGADTCNDLKAEQAHHSKRHQETSDSRSKQVEALMTMDALGCNAETHAL